jgi:hypothetical protein
MVTGGIVGEGTEGPRIVASPLPVHQHMREPHRAYRSLRG